MLLPVFVCDGQNFHRASSRPAYPRSAPYVRSTLYDVWRQHPCPTENPRPSRHKNDHALCSPSA
ncbi:hypothetical protein PHA72_08240 [Enterobacter ludwigii]|uniref:Porphobilinogen synthase n=1 Tax=Enterobacter ludwigii TaxID=299767 RepID=A0AAX3LHH4_9ENTR|nr:hypothetical protein [Enterobacter ludwigii]WCE15717.1 hypothetical protein PHA72_08240 [Enterobacter ludwigii]